MEIFQPWDNGLHLNYIDEIMFDDLPIADIEFNRNTITKSSSLPYIPQRTLTSETSSEITSSDRVKIELFGDALPINTGMIYFTLIIVAFIAFKRRKLVG